MIEAVICDQRRIFTACTYLYGEYGCRDIYLGIPVILGKNGVTRILELELDDDDIIRFEASKKEVDITLKMMREMLRVK